jgi:hypothetical protein
MDYKRILMRIMEKNVISIFLILLMFLFLSAIQCPAEDGKPIGEVSLESNQVHSRSSVYLGAGYFIPNEGALRGSPIGGLEYKYSYGKEAAFLDFLYSTSQSDSPLNGVTNSIKNYITQIGYMRNPGGSRMFRLGGGLQIHRMEIGSLMSSTKTTLTGIAEYDISKSASFRLQASAKTKMRSTPFGSYLIAAVFFKL